MQSTPRIDGLGQISDQYDLVLCDVWGVLHNGKAIYEAAADALRRFRENGGVVVMITNAPRPAAPVLRQLARLGCPDGVFDEVVTSGDVTRGLIAALEGSVYHIGPDRDFSLYEGLDVTFSEPEDAAGIVCTGLFNDREETPEDYHELWRRTRELDLPFICANPDIVVEFGDQLLWCAGALARDYKTMGGTTLIAGKPYAPIYEMAIERASQLLKRPPDTRRMLAIGDGMPTDIAGAIDFGIDVLFIAGGIHAAEYLQDGRIMDEKLDLFLNANEVSPVAWTPRLAW